jgi:hypothetical protein
MSPVENLSEPMTHIVDASAVGVVIAVWASWLPGIASLLTVIWMALRIYETLQNIAARRRKPDGS